MRANFILTRDPVFHISWKLPGTLDLTVFVFNSKWHSVYTTEAVVRNPGPSRGLVSRTVSESCFCFRLGFTGADLRHCCCAPRIQENFIQVFTTVFERDLGLVGKFVRNCFKNNFLKRLSPLNRANQPEFQVPPLAMAENIYHRGHRGHHVGSTYIPTCVITVIYTS